jgi:hypothetical protein
LASQHLLAGSDPLLALRAFGLVVDL